MKSATGPQEVPVQINQLMRYRDQCLPHQVLQNEKLSWALFRRVLDVRWIHLVQGVQVKLKSSRANVGGIVWERNGRRLPACSEVPHGVRKA